jgi:hypothetical protein
MFFINKLKNQKERHCSMAGAAHRPIVAVRGNTKKALRWGAMPSPGERFHQA